MLQERLAEAKDAQRSWAQSTLAARHRVLSLMEDLLFHRQDIVLKANQEDLAHAERQGLDEPRRARLRLSEAKLQGLAQGLAAVRQLPDPLGLGTRRTLANGLVLEQVQVPLGVVALIYESRPSVTVEAVSLVLKSGNAILLRGSREAQHTNAALVTLWQEALKQAECPQSLVQLLDDPSRAMARQLMHLEGLDLLIPRGGASLIKTVVQEATVPVVETGVGNCHLYVDAAADLAMAVRILRDGKVGNPAVCNALETVLVHRSVHRAFLPMANDALKADGVVWHGDACVQSLVPGALPATEADWSEEYLGLHLAARVVDSLDEALTHVHRYGTRHSETIVTNDHAVGERFLAEVDAAVVYWNASTRFSDGYQFGLGGEMGISTQKLHARGPMGMAALTSTKTLAYGNGQTRDF
ncbi:MAG: glutamate-5-semialdehyde dehydrogenase [Firmicutes bacterium]|nr:glutamate-5-semialdehyde dehydrogenase [Bacillota bacterium]